MTDIEYIEAISDKLSRVKHLVVTIKKDGNAIALARNSIPSADPTNTHLIAHEPTEKEIGEIFKQLPWCQYISFRDEAVISRKAWEISTKKEEKKDASSHP